MKRLFKFKNKVTISTIILFSILLIVSVVCSCIEPDKFYGWVLVGVLALFFISMAFIGYFTPILYNDKVVRCGKKEIKWEDIRITAYPIGGRSIYISYYLLFDTEYLKGKQAKNVVRQKFYVLLSIESLQIISLYYKQKICVLDSNRTNFTDDLLVSKKLKQALFEHNTKYSY